MPVTQQMSSQNGNMHATAPVPTLLVATRIKREPVMLLSNGNAKLAKLTSFSPARDITLGGRGSLNGVNKKVFTPNLNVVRNKNTNVKTSKDTTTRGRGRGRSERGRGANSGAARGNRGGGANSSLIQTTGVFSEGAGAVNIRKSSGGINGGSHSRSIDDAPSALRRPLIVKREHQQHVDMQAETAHVRELLGSSDDESDFDGSKTDTEQIPVKLSEAKWMHLKLEKPEIKLEKEVEKDTLHVSASDAKANQLMQQIQQMQMQQRSLDSLGRYPSNVAEFLDATPSKLFLMQLPDALPCESEGNDSPEKVAAHDAKEHSNSSNDSIISIPAIKTNSNSLQDVEEGQVGKLLRYRSGKIKLVLGESHFDLDMGMETGFLQTLVSINTNREERSGNMVNLGRIQAKLTATPDWEFMLQQQGMAQQP